MADNLLEITQILSKRFNNWWSSGASPVVPLFKRRDFDFVKKVLGTKK